MVMMMMMMMIKCDKTESKNSGMVGGEKERKKERKIKSEKKGENTSQNALEDPPRTSTSTEAVSSYSPLLPTLFTCPCPKSKNTTV